MIFLHPEFIFWMSPFMGILFYFWFTQKRHNEYHFTSEALEKLQVDGSALGEHGRNWLFFGASLLLILALAQPIVQQEKIIDEPTAITIALDISTQPLSEFEAMKKSAMELVDTIEGSVELVAYDAKVYRIAPASVDKKILKELIENLSPQSMHTSVSDENRVQKVCKTSNIVIVSGSKAVDSGAVKTISKPKEHWEYAQFFYFPLGLAMVLIAIALSSMSKRQSVSIALVAMICAGENDARAGVMDFRILEKANSAYSHGEYEQSARYFNDYRLLHDSPQIRYNYANALFKAGHYDRAQYWYEQVHTNDPKLKEWVWINRSLLPSKEGKSVQKPSKNGEKSVSEVKIRQEREKGEIRNKTPLFSY